MAGSKDDMKSPTNAAEDAQDLKLVGEGSSKRRPSIVLTENDSHYGIVKAKIWDGSMYKVYKVDGKNTDEVPICRNSLFCIPITSRFRKVILAIVEHQWFDSFILFCIVINSILMVLEQHRAGKHCANCDEGWEDDNVPNLIGRILGNYILTIIFTLECVLKIIAWGFILNKKTYLRDTWNILDFVVVISSLVELAGIGGSLGFLRLFRVLRPLRSLNRVPQLKILVNTAISAVPRLGSVAALGGFIFLVFAIIGVTLMPGIFYRRCREVGGANLVIENGIECWKYEYASEGGADGRLCGGLYNCVDYVKGQPYTLGECAGHEFDMDESLRPRFNGGVGPAAGGPPWCQGSEPAKWSVGADGSISGFPETDFVHFDHIFGAFLLIFQSMTMEGWTDFMYYTVDAVNVVFAWFYFFMLIIITSHFLLNVALAVVDEAREDFENEEEEEEEEERKAAEKAGGEPAVAALAAEMEHIHPEDEDSEDWDDDPEPWLNRAPVRVARTITRSDIFSNFILLIISGNVVTMMLESFPPQVALEKPKTMIGQIFLVVFIIEMFLELLARGPLGYVKNPTTCFDGIVVIVSIVEEVLYMTGGNAGGLKALRTLRLFRVLNKFASRSPPLKILLKAMVATGDALKYWLVLFFLVLFIATLTWMHFFANRFQYAETGNDPAEAFAMAMPYDGENPDPWCKETRHLGNDWNHLRQGCIPRAHFDNFGWGFVTVFQIMTGENWNTIMYAAMRSGGCSPEGGVPGRGLQGEGSGWVECGFYGLMHVGLLLFGQILFLSLFLSMLLSLFDKKKDELTEDHHQQEQEQKARVERRSKSQSSIIMDRSDSQQELNETNTVTEHVKDQDPQLGSHSSDGVSIEAADALPGQLVELPQEAASPEPTSCKNSHEEKDLQEADQADQPGEIPSKKTGWPYGYSWFVLHEQNPIRVAATWVLQKKGVIMGKDVDLFDNFILICILISTVFMCLNSPLQDDQAEGWGWLYYVRQADIIFTVIFIVEMALKLLAYPVVWGENAYFTGAGCAWNWLDAMVVGVSIMSLVFEDGPTFLKTLRVLRAFRPLRVINRMETLKMVVETIFKSMMELGVLLIVFLLSLLIFALVGLMYLKGTYYACGGENIAYTVDLNALSFSPATMPSCYDPIFSDTSYPGAIPSKLFNDTSRALVDSPCTSNQLQWRRPTADTPICVARCNPYTNDTQEHLLELCPQRYWKPEQLPSVCPEVDNADGTPRFAVDTYAADEVIGNRFINAMQRSYAIPCGGAAADDLQYASSISCQQTFCPDVSNEKSQSCSNECKDHPDFCSDTCKGGSDTLECTVCRRECEAACECPEFCTPLIKDAALCHEQGGSWDPVLRQNFDNVWNAMLTLLEISTTEGWVDVMYAACDIDMGGRYVQPQRDSETHWFFMAFFSIWIMVSFMFLLNLCVGIIVDKFMEMQNAGEEAFLLPGQAKWVKSRMCLQGRSMIFSLYNLHELPPIRRKFYDVVSHPFFERFILTCIVVNTLMMGIVSFPELEDQDWWNAHHVGLKGIFGYFFALIFTVECVLKMIALQCCFWKDSWNIFDFVCVMATLIGIILDVANTGINIATLASVVRIFRIARLFRLLRFKPLRPLNKLFMSLAISLVKLANVGVVMVLFLILFSILGVSLFSTVKAGDTLNEHGNFRHFPNAFVTLFRASTGEAWNEIMHDLAKNEADWFREGEWCTPAHLFDTKASFQVLKDKCLIDYPNSCLPSIDGWNPFPWLYWISYTLLIGMVIMNVVIAVILQGYDETRTSDEGAIIDTCKTLWGDKYDKDRKMKLKAQGKGGAIHFVFAALQELQHDGLVPGSIEIPLGGQLTRIPMKYARALDVKIEGDDEVTFHSATMQVLRMIAVLDAEHGGSADEFEHVVAKLDQCDSEEVMRKSKEMRLIKALEKKHQPSDSPGGCELAQTIAASKMQVMFKLARQAKQNRADRESQQAAQIQDLTGSAQDGHQDDSSEDLRAAAASEAVAEPTGPTPPVAG